MRKRFASVNLLGPLQALTESEERAKQLRRQLEAE
jgi:hypothetical protein